jgi:hypothetical protein
VGPVGREELGNAITDAIAISIQKTRVFISEFSKSQLRKFGELRKRSCCKMSNFAEWWLA